MAIEYMGLNNIQGPLAVIEGVDDSMVINTAKSSAPSYAFTSAAVLALRMSPPT